MGTEARAQTEWRIEMLGGLQLRRESGCVEVSNRGVTRELLICLALRLGERGSDKSCSRAELIKRGWGKPPDEGRDNLRHALPHLHRLLEPEGIAPGSVLREQGEKVSLNPERVGTDVADFLAAYEEAAGAEGAAEQAERLTKAADLYHGELLPGYDQPWIAAHRKRLAEQNRDALHRLKAALLETDRLPEAVEAALRLCSSFPPEDEAFRVERDEAWQDYRALLDESSRKRRASPPLPGILPPPSRPGPPDVSRRAPVFLAGALALLSLAVLLTFFASRAQKLHRSEQEAAQRLHERDRLYQEGRASWNARTEEGLRQSRADFARVNALDPDYAPGYAGLADADSLLGYYGWVPPREALKSALDEAREATARAQNDAEKAESYTSLAWVEMLLWKWDQSKSDFQQALSADQRYATAHQWYSLYLTVQGDEDGSLIESNQAVGRDPTPVICMSAAQRLHYKGDYDYAIQKCDDSLKKHPGDRLTHYWLGLAYEQEGNTGEALAAIGDADRLSGGRDMNMRAGLAHAFATSGDGARSRRLLAEMEMRRCDGLSYVSPVDLAVVYTGLYNHDRNTVDKAQAFEEKEQALTLLEQGYREHACQLFLLGIEPRFASLRREPRFARLLKKLHLPPAPEFVSIRRN